ncbi:MAG: HlyD family efflux transporter periplasmic adaptor subunit [Bacteroidota bacterium]|nr:hemolysin D [Odoribacter sp.]MDP3645380.1 HlyD family efflux transporter periplasmic adaptor subunit [Bacteroidota bacterium]
MEKENLEQTAQRTEEVRDIIDRMPYRTGRIVAILVTGLCVLLLFFGWLIEYPETVSGPVTITARQAPVRLVANISGKLHLLKNNGDSLHENDIIGFMDNPAKLLDVLEVERFLNENQIEKLVDSHLALEFPETTALGELSSVYFSFRNALEKLEQYRTGKPYEKKRASLISLVNSQMQLSSHNRKQMETKASSLKIAGKNIHRDSLLYGSSTIAELELDRSSISYLGLLESAQAMNKEEASYQLQLNDTRHKLQLLQVEQQGAEQQLRMDVITGYNELSNSFRQWKQRYLFVAPFAGTLENMNFWHENDFLPAGTETFSVLPADNPLLGQVFLPSQGAGKVVIGQKVIIKLDNYPYMEYGSVDGQVHSISMLTNQAEAITRQNNMRTYLVTVDLPNRLSTNYGAILDFRYEIKGIADIVTKRRKLLERLFDNLKYIASKK